MPSCQILFLHSVQLLYNNKLSTSCLGGIETPVYSYTDQRTSVCEEGVFGNCVSLGTEWSCLKIMSVNLSITRQKEHI